MEVDEINSEWQSITKFKKKKKKKEYEKTDNAIRDGNDKGPIDDTVRDNIEGGGEGTWNLRTHQRHRLLTRWQVYQFVLSSKRLRSSSVESTWTFVVLKWCKPNY